MLEHHHQHGRRGTGEIRRNGEAEGERDAGRTRGPNRARTLFLWGASWLVGRRPRPRAPPGCGDAGRGAGRARARRGARAPGRPRRRRNLSVRIPDGPDDPVIRGRTILPRGAPCHTPPPPRRFKRKHKPIGSSSSWLRPIFLVTGRWSLTAPPSRTSVESTDLKSYDVSRGRGAPGRESGATGEHATRARPRLAGIRGRATRRPPRRRCARAERWQKKLDGGPGRRSRSAGEVGAGRRPQATTVRLPVGTHRLSAASMCRVK